MRVANPSRAKLAIEALEDRWLPSAVGFVPPPGPPVHETAWRDPGIFTPHAGAPSNAFSRPGAEYSILGSVGDSHQPLGIYAGHWGFWPEERAVILVMEVGWSTRGPVPVTGYNTSDGAGIVGSPRSDFILAIARPGTGQNVGVTNLNSTPVVTGVYAGAQRATDVSQAMALVPLSASPGDVRALHEAALSLQGSGGGEVDSAGAMDSFALNRAPGVQGSGSKSDVDRPSIAYSTDRLPGSAKETLMPVGSGLLGEIFSVDVSAVEQSLERFLNNLNNASQWVISPPSSRPWAAGWMLIGIGTGALVAQFVHWWWAAKPSVEPIRLPHGPSGTMRRSHLLDFIPPAD
jgi:hypothetical protein